MGDMKMAAWIEPPTSEEFDAFLIDLAASGAAGGNVVAVPFDEVPVPTVDDAAGVVDVRPPCPLY